MSHKRNVHIERYKKLHPYKNTLRYTSHDENHYLWLRWASSLYEIKMLGYIQRNRVYFSKNFTPVYYHRKYPAV